MSNIEFANQNILQIVAISKLPEDLPHAKNTLKWLLRLQPKADESLRLAALAHDIDRAGEHTKVKRLDFKDYSSFKAAHAKHSAEILQSILEECKVEKSVVEESCRLVSLHEVGGDDRSDLLMYADSISFFDVNLPHYFRPHRLTGDWVDYWEGHIEPDWLLIYRRTPTALILVRTGTHADLFK